MKQLNIPLRTDANGALSIQRHMTGRIIAIEVRLGTLDTPDIDVTDDANGDSSILSVNGVAADTLYQIGLVGVDDSGAPVVDVASPVVLDGITVALTGAGNTKRGSMHVFYEDIKSLVIPIGPTAANGTWSQTRRFVGQVHAILVDIGDGGTALSTPDVDVTEDDKSLSLLSVDGVAADTIYPITTPVVDDGGSEVTMGGTDATPAVAAPVVYGHLKVAVTGAGDTKSGSATIFYS